MNERSRASAVFGLPQVMSEEVLKLQAEKEATLGQATEAAEAAAYIASPWPDASPLLGPP